MCNRSVMTKGKPRIVDNAGWGELPIGIEDFETVLRNFVYVDKTLVVRDLIRRQGTTLFCRPRRFGKSLFIRMLQCFFEAPVKGFVRDRRQLFQNLAIAEAGERFWRHCGIHPVIRVNLSGVDGKTWAEARELLTSQVASEYERHRYVLGCGIMSDEAEAKYRNLLAKEGSRSDLSESLSWLSDVLRDFHGQQTVILVDEYDNPIVRGHIAGWREEVTTFMRTWLTGALKDTDSLFFAALTGVQRVSKESIFSDLNNITVDTPLNHQYAESFGFTEAEAEALAAHVGMAERVDDMRTWYDGYSFGGTRVYNPWSTLNFLREGIMQPYWANTSGNAIVKELIAHADAATERELGILAQGGGLEHAIDLSTVFDDLKDNPDAVWSQLYLAGYLTTDDVEFPNDAEISRRLRIPNGEVRRLFSKELVIRANRVAGSAGRLRDLYGAMASADPARLDAVLGSIVLDSPSFHDLTDEGHCHMLLLAMLYDMPGYRMPESNRESGTGRSDILLRPDAAHAASLPAIVIEVKRMRRRGKDEPTLEALAAHARDVALAQAREREYGHGVEAAGRLLWGVAFGGKRVRTACELV